MHEMAILKRQMAMFYAKQDPRAKSHMSEWLHGQRQNGRCLSAQMLNTKSAQMDKCTNAKMHKCASAQMHKCTRYSTPKCQRTFVVCEMCKVEAFGIRVPATISRDIDGHVLLRVKPREVVVLEATRLQVRCEARASIAGTDRNHLCNTHMQMQRQIQIPTQIQRQRQCQSSTSDLSINASPSATAPSSTVYDACTATACAVRLQQTHAPTTTCHTPSKLFRPISVEI